MAKTKTPEVKEAKSSAEDIAAKGTKVKFLKPVQGFAYKEGAVASIKIDSDRLAALIKSKRLEKVK